MDSSYYNSYWSVDSPPPHTDPTTPERRRRLLKTLQDVPLSRDANILDLGCGQGEFVRILVEAQYRVVGVDISSKAVELAKKALPSVDFRVLKEDRSIPCESSRFDAVWSTEVIEHIFDIHQHLSEINRVLKAGGIYILTTPYHGVVKDVLVSLLKFDQHFDPEGSHIRFFDKRGLERCLGRAGFTPISWDGIGRVPWLYRTWYVVARKTSEPALAPQIQG
jgi:SAM-dependent methyltransferase